VTVDLRAAWKAAEASGGASEWAEVIRGLEALRERLPGDRPNLDALEAYAWGQYWPLAEFVAEGPLDDPGRWVE
jgi:hypothetical protein